MDIEEIEHLIGRLINLCPTNNKRECWDYICRHVPEFRNESLPKAVFYLEYSKHFSAAAANKKN